MRSLWLRVLAVVLGGSMLLVGCLPTAAAYAAAGGVATFPNGARAKADVLISANWRAVRASLPTQGYAVLYNGIQALPYQGNGNLAVVEIPSQIPSTNQGALDVFIVDLTTNAIVGESLVTVAPNQGSGDFSAQVVAPGNTVNLVLDSTGRILTQTTTANDFSPLGQAPRSSQLSPGITTQQECQAGIGVTGVTGVLYCAVWGFIILSRGDLDLQVEEELSSSCRMVGYGISTRASVPVSVLPDRSAAGDARADVRMRPRGI